MTMLCVTWGMMREAHRAILICTNDQNTHPPCPSRLVTVPREEQELNSEVTLIMGQPCQVEG